MTRSYTFALMLVVTVGLTTGAAIAQTDFATPMVDQIEADGFTVTKVKRTLLGRTLIVSKNAQGLRETVLNPHTGAILRDRVFTPSPQGGPGMASSGSAGGAGGNGSGGGNGGGGGKN